MTSKDLSTGGPVNQCTAHRKSGEQCKRSAIRGGTVCATHGGRAPQVIRRAQQRILEASDKAAYALVQMMQDEKIPPAVRVSAARDLLDRAGLTGRQELTVQVRTERTHEDVIEGFLVDIPEPEAVEDAVVVEDPDTADDVPLARDRRRVLPSADPDRQPGRSMSQDDIAAASARAAAGSPLSRQGEEVARQQHREHRLAQDGPSYGRSSWRRR